MANCPAAPLLCLSERTRFSRFVGRAVTVSLILVGLNSPTVAWAQPTTIAESPAEVNSAEGSTKTGSDQQLFQDLQSDKFQVRENAMYQLAKRGDIVLPEIAKRYFTAPPETVYRIRKILEGVSSSGDEQTFLRATSLLLTLYSNGNEEMAQRIESLKADWRKRRKDNAVQAIIGSGGKVVSNYNAQPHLQLRQALMNRQVENNVPSQSANNSAAKQQKLDVDQQRELVATIMANSVDDNRNFILEHSKAISSSKPKVIQYTYRAPLPISVQFPDGWVADKSILLKLGELDGPVVLELGAIQLNDDHWRALKSTEAIISVALNAVALPDSATAAFPLDVRAITLRNYSLATDFCKSLGQLSSLVMLQLSNCKMSAESVAALNRLKRVSSIPVSFVDTKVDADSISALSRLNRATVISMDNVQVSPAALAELEKLPKIRSLKLASMSIDKGFLESVGRMKNLSRLELRGCEFDVDAFKRLESKRPIPIDFQPKAFLGVGPAGGGRPGTQGCQIAYIAPGSAAAREGIQVGDVIRAIDGDPVKTFHEVRLKIAQYDPGEKMSVKIERADKMLELNVELGKNSAVDP